jgi:hypothetical protein
MGMQGLKPSVLVRKLKQQCPPGVSSDKDDLFLSMFLIRLPPSMREAVGAGTHEMAAAMVKAETPCGMLGAATTVQSQSPQHRVGALLLAMGSEATQGAVMPAPKISPLPTQIFIPLQTLAMACVNFTIITPIRLTGAFRPVLGQKTSMPPNHFRFSG